MLNIILARIFYMRFNEFNELGQQPITPPTIQQWAKKVKLLYPDVQFIHQKMLNGVTFAMSAKAGGKVGFYDPKRGINKTVPVGAPVIEADSDNVALGMIGQIPQTDLRNRPSFPSKRLEVGGVIGYMPKIAGRPTGKVIKAEVLEIGGVIGRSAVRVKLLDPKDIAANGGKSTAIISQLDVRQNPYQSMNEDFEDLPNELMDPQAWKVLDDRQKYKALYDANLVTSNEFLKQWMNGSDYVPSEIRYGKLDLNKIYRNALADYQDRKHSSDLISQDRENELNIGSEGRSELKRKADELAEIKREKLRNERLHDEEVAFQRAETVQQREDEMKKIADQYKHELTVIDKEHRNNMEAIRTNNTFELDKLDKEYNDNQRERDFKSSESDKEFRDRNKDREFRAGESDKEFRDRNQDREFRSGESDKDYADRQREREHQQSMADKEREQSGTGAEEPRPRPQRPRPEAGPRPEPTKPAKPEPQTWHTSQQVGNDVEDDEDDVEDVEARPYSPYTPRPSKPMALNAPKRESVGDDFLSRIRTLSGLK